MKKLLALILAGLMIFAFAACGEKDDTNKGDNGNETVAETKDDVNGTPKLEGVEAPADILTAVWSTYGEDEKFFAMGGDADHPVDNAPGAFDISNKETLTAMLICPADTADMIDSAASLIHAMNANTFTGAAYKLKDATQVEAFITAMKTAIQGNRWMCGFPEKLLTAKVTDDYVVVVFGNGELVENFKTKLTAKYDFAAVEVEAIG